MPWRIVSGLRFHEVLLTTIIGQITKENKKLKNTVGVFYSFCRLGQGKESKRSNEKEGTKERERKRVYKKYQRRRL